MEQILTATGKLATIPAATRLPIPVYKAALDQASREGISLGELLRRIILRELVVSESEAKGVR